MQSSFWWCILHVAEYSNIELQHLSSKNPQLTETLDLFGTFYFNEYLSFAIKHEAEMKTK